MKLKVVISEILVAAVIGVPVAFFASVILLQLDSPLWLIAILGIVVGSIVGSILGAIVGILLSRHLSIKFQLEHLPPSAADYIKLVIKYMRYRRIARQEVADELTDHFELALDDCHTEPEKQQRTQHLIDNFGDPRLLAILLRRAKKRCRPLWRTVVARSFQALAVLIICLILYIVWFLTGKPSITTDYIAELNNLARPSADDSLNAAPLYNKAVETLVDANDFKELLRLDFNNANDEQKELIKQWLTKNEASLALITQASLLPHYWQKYQPYAPEQSLFGVLLPFLSDFRFITYALCWRAWLNAQDGNFDSALIDIETSYRLGRHNKGEKSLVEQLVGTAIEGLALKTARQILDTCKIPSDTLADFQRRLRLLIDNDDFKINLKVEKLGIYDEIQRCFTESRFGFTHLYPKRIAEIERSYNLGAFSNQKVMLPEKKWLVNLCLALAPGLALENWPWIFSHPDKAESIAATNAIYKFWEEIDSKTPARLQAEDVNLAAELERMIKNNLLLRICIKNLSKFDTIAWRIKIDAESTLLIIALVRFKQDTGSYPETLDKLVETGYITKIPTDPFSDAPLRYKKTEQGPLLYSFGSNLTDDGGQVTRDMNGKVTFGDEGDWVFWPVIKD